MGTRADFYIGIDKPNWIGSLVQDGQPWNIPCKILVQNNKVLYEENVIDFLSSKGGLMYEWPWPWEDSKLTDYSYFFDPSSCCVLTYSMVDKITFNPLKIMQGDDLKTARVNVTPNFPLMGVGYGSNTTKAL